jgi:rhodanese-related sulfurtransferase
MISNVTRDDLKEKIIRGDKFYLIEIASAEDASRSHIPGSLRIPQGKIREQASQVLLNRSADLVFFC